MCDISLTFLGGTNREPEIKLGNSANYQEIDMKLPLVSSQTEMVIVEPRQLGYGDSGSRSHQLQEQSRNKAGFDHRPYITFPCHRGYAIAILQEVLTGS